MNPAQRKPKQRQRQRRFIHLPIDIKVIYEAEPRMTVKQLAVFAASVGGRVVNDSAAATTTFGKSLIGGFALELDADRLATLLVAERLSD